MKYLVVLFCLAGVVGCGGGQSGAEIAGTVTFAEGGPLPKGVVNINGPGGSYRAAINPDGTYSMAGVADGTYKVTITGATEGPAIQGDMMQYDADGNYIETEPVEPKSLIKSIYSDSNQSGLSMKVPGEYDLQVLKPE